jgi:CubicO group peptidase (beta-lactamase class C family)
MDASGRLDPDASDAIVPWWSFTKTALAIAALQLVEKRYLQLDDHINGCPFTLRQLLQHRAGVPNYSHLASYRDAVERRMEPWGLEELFDRVAVCHLDFVPGTNWRYSNTGYAIVRRLIENAIGQDIGTVLQKFLFDRLDIRSVQLATRRQDLADTVWGNQASYDPGWVYHGLLIGTPADAVRLLCGLLSGHVLSQELLTEMKSRHPIHGMTFPGRPWQTTGYGLGLMIDQMTSVGLAIGHSGGGPGSVGAVYHFSERSTPCTIGAFAVGDTEGAAEKEIVRLAQSD